MTVPAAILVPTDFHDASEAAASYAFDLAERIGAKVHLLHVFDVPTDLKSAGYPVTPVPELRYGIEAGLDAIAQRRAGSPALGRSLTVLGDPAQKIAELARELGVDLIVMSTHARRGLSRALLGSVTESVIRSAHCPVLVLRSGEPPISG